MIFDPIALTRLGGITSFFPFQESRCRVLQLPSVLVVAQAKGLKIPPAMFFPARYALKSMLPSGFLTIPAGTVVVVTGIGRTSRQPSKLKKKYVLFLLRGPPTVPPN